MFPEGAATRLVRPLHPQHFDLPGVWEGQPFEDLDRGGFPGAVGPQESEAFAAMDGEIESRDRRDVVVLLDESGGANRWAVGAVRAAGTVSARAAHRPRACRLSRAASRS